MIREWEKLEYYDSKKILLGLRDIATSLPLNSLPYHTASLRDRNLRQYGESRQCALFCYGMSKVLGVEVSYAQYEHSDYDFVSARKYGDILYYTPIQMKELVPETLNTKATIEKEILKLKKYVDSQNLVVAIHLNRAESINISEINIPELNISQLWLFGASEPDQRRWLMFGDLLNEPQYYEFEYPAT